MRFQVAEKFRIRTPNGEIELNPGQVITLTEERARGLILNGRVVPLLSEDPPKVFRGCFEKADSEVETVHLLGTIQMIREDFPELWTEIEEAEDKINILWLQAREGAGDMETFREAVKKWKVLHLRAIKFFSLIEGRIRGNG